MALAPCAEVVSEYEGYGIIGRYCPGGNRVHLALGPEPETRRVTAEAPMEWRLFSGELPSPDYPIKKRHIRVVRIL
jgi:hypothetical protein